jgi:hypothetical protein
MLFVALIAARFLPHRLQQIQLLIQAFRPQANPGLRDFGQPLGAMPPGIDGGTATGNRPTAIQRFDPAQDSRDIFVISR